MKDEWKKFRTNLPAPPAREGHRLTGRSSADKKGFLARLDEKYDVRKHGVAFVVLDCSSSMMEGNKLQQAKSGALEFADSAARKGYEVGLIRFDDEAALVARPTPRPAELRAPVGELTAGGTTNMADGLTLAEKNLGEGYSRAAIVLVTDGLPNDRAATLLAAARLKDKGVDLIAIGTENADHAFLAQLASREELASVVAPKALGKAITASVQLLPPASAGDS